MSQSKNENSDVEKESPDGEAMVSGSKKTATRHYNLQMLRSITKSQALNKISIITNASRYIEELNKDITQASSDDQNELPLVTVETLENGFLLNVLSEKSCAGLLLCILQALEDVGVVLLKARVSWNERFRFQALGGEHDEQGEAVEAGALKEAVVKAIEKWREGSGQK